MVRLLCLLAASAPAVLLLGCNSGEQKTAIVSQHGTRNTTLDGLNFSSTYAYDAESGASVQRRPNDASVTLQTGGVVYFVTNVQDGSSDCCQMSADESHGTSAEIKTTSSGAKGSLPQCEDAATTEEACWEAALEKVGDENSTFIDETALYHVPAGHGINESWASVNSTVTIRLKAHGLIDSVNVTQHTNVSDNEIQVTSSSGIDFFNMSTSFDMQPGFPAGWADLATWWKHGSCDTPCIKDARFQAGVRRARLPVTAGLQTAVMV